MSSKFLLMIVQEFQRNILEILNYVIFISFIIIIIGFFKLASLSFLLVLIYC